MLSERLGGPSPAPPGPPLTHGPQTGPWRRAMWGRLAHQLRDGWELVDPSMHFVGGGQHGPIGAGLQMAARDRAVSVPPTLSPNTDRQGPTAQWSWLAGAPEDRVWEPEDPLTFRQ